MRKYYLILVSAIIIITGFYFAWRADMFRVPGEPQYYSECVAEGGRLVGGLIKDCSYYGKIFSGFADN